MVAIKDMEMPKCCSKCPLFHFYLDTNGIIHFICKYGNMEMCGDLNNKRNDCCPLIEENQREKLANRISDVAKMYPQTYSDKIHDAVTIDEGIEEVEQVGIRKGLELAIDLIKGTSKTESEGNK